MMQIPSFSNDCGDIWANTEGLEAIQISAVHSILLLPNLVFLSSWQLKYDSHNLPLCQPRR